MSFLIKPFSAQVRDKRWREQCRRLLGITDETALTLRAGTTRLRAPTSSDKFAVWLLFSDPEMLYWSTGQPIPQTEQECYAWIERLVQDPRSVLFTVETDLKHSCWPGGETTLGCTVGFVWLQNVERGNAFINIGFPAKHQGRLWVYQAAALGLIAAFERMNLHRVTASIIDGNTRSERLMEFFGFQLEGHLREVSYLAGSWRNVTLWGMLHDDMPAWLRSQEGRDRE